MKPFFALALAASAVALPSLQVHDPRSFASAIHHLTNSQTRQVAETTPFTGLAIRSGSDIQYASIAANGLSFWLNKDTATYTPENVPAHTNATTSTVFTQYLSSDTLSLLTSVPGGQQVYVAADGQLKFTQAHSASTGNGSFVQGFGIAQGHLLFENTGFVAVATNETSNTPGR